MRCSALLLAAVSFFVFLVLALVSLYLSNPNEDAFILFKYAENLAAGRGIVYYPGGPRTEGATDFLWLLMLSALSFMGMDVAIAAAFLNAVGAGVASFLFVSVTPRGLSAGLRLLFLALALTVPFLGGAVAAYEGFSAMLYSALILVVFRLSLEDSTLIYVPTVAGLVALFRPDGAIVAASAVLVGVFWSRRSGRLTVYVRHVLPVVALGVAYFVGRWLYFGEVLPLPLLVKSFGSIYEWIEILPGVAVPYYEGLRQNLRWLLDPFGPATLFGGFALALVCLANRSAAHYSRHVASHTPLFALLVSLCFAHHTQNIAYRFQSPVFLVLFFSTTCMLAELLPHNASRRRRVFAVGCFVVGVLVPLSNGLYAALAGLNSRSYVEGFSNRASLLVGPDHRVALTEAGRIAFWWPGPVYDLGGLNNRDAARTPATSAYLASIDPDLVMFHPTSMRKVALPAGWSRMVAVPPGQIGELFTEEMKELFAAPPSSYRFEIPVPAVAAAAAARFLSERTDYDVFLAFDFDFDGTVHVLAFRKSLVVSRELKEALQWSLDWRNYRSYARLRGLPTSEARFWVRAAGLCGRLWFAARTLRAGLLPS